MSAKVLPSSRSELDVYLKGNELRTKFHDLFDAFSVSQADIKKKQEKKKPKKRTKNKSKDKKSKRDKSPDPTDSAPPSLEICVNPSMFTVYSTVRQSILEQCMKEATQIYHQSQSLPSDSDSDDDREDKNKEGPIKLPKIVGLGLTGVFELVRDTKEKYPELCVKALTALLDMLQGQQPESMKSEPPEVIENFFNLLKDIALWLDPDKELSALACSALLSLVIALGDTGKLLTAVRAMLMGAGALSSQDIMVPGILTGLQKSVQAVLLGKSILPDWLTQGVKQGSEIDKFKIEDLPDVSDSSQNSAIASDGEYLYLLNKEGIFKVGSGYKGTIKSHIYQHQSDFPKSANSWLTCAGGQLFCRTDDNTHPCLSVVDSKTFDLKNSFHLDGKGHGPCALFSDGDYIGQIASAKDDSFVVRLYNPSVSPMTVVSELPLKLTRKCMDVYGSTGYDPETEKRSVNTGFDEDSVFIVSGKEFSLIRTSGNKVLYTGRSQALGIKQGGPSQGKWAELPITKSPKIVQVSTGHEGQHALMVSEDGSLFFVGTAKRGEDGDASSSKARRQPKAVKPKKIIRLETMSKHVVYAACNNGSSGILTKEGEVFIFGKDTTHCDHSTGQVTDLKDVIATQIALGKAHTVVLTDRGQVYTFGINNKGQCGRDFMPGGNKEVNNVNMTEEEEETEVEDGICPDGKHKWKRDQCMVCTVCGECTGYGINCCNSGGKERNPSLPCGCGAGESGCAECGVCRSCAGEQLLDMEDHGKELELIRAKGFLNIDMEQLLGGNELKVNHMPDLPDTPLGQFFKRLLYNKKEPKKKDAFKNQAKGGEHAGNEGETDYNKVVSLPPQEICFGNGDVPATNIVCGQHHTVVLLQNGDVYTFGNNNHGQLGQGDTTIRGSPVKVDLPMGATQVATGGHHTVVLLSNGQVYTFGNHKSGALGRNGPDEGGAGAKPKKAWNTVPGPVPGIGARYGRRATWIGASGDQTFMRIDESLINAHILAASKVFANHTSIGLVPTGEENTAVMKCLMINKLDGSCRSFGGNSQVDLSKHAVCIDPVYDVLWSYSPETKEISCYNSLVTEARPLSVEPEGHCDLFKPELAVPIKMGHRATRSHCALHVLGCLDTLNIAQQLNLTVKEESREKLSTTKVYSKEDYSVVNRFASHGGGWGYSGHSMEAIRFMCDTDVLLGGFGLFGGRGEYYGRIKLFELGQEGGENETDGEMISESDEVVYECGAREKYAMMFDEPIQIQAQTWYVAWARISGPSSDCGSNGQPIITTDDQVVFKFRSSKKSNNGTDVNAGQIPQLLFRLPSKESSGVARKVDNVEPAHILSQDFACTVTPECFEALLLMINWAWTTFNTAIREVDGLKGDNYSAAVSDVKRLVYVNKACLRLLRTYVQQIYPDGTTSHKPVNESEKLTSCIGKTQDLLRNILAQEVRPSIKVRVYLSEPGSHSLFHELEDEVLNECHITFRACFHAFYPTGNLKWLCLCDLLQMLEPEMLNISGYGRLLAAVMEAMCHPTIRLTNIMPINSEPKTEEILRRQSIVMDDNTNSMARLNDQHRFPLLVAHMTCKLECAGFGVNHVSFREVLDKLLTIITLPVRQELDKEKPTYPSVLVDNTCALLSTIISELSATSIGLEMDLTTTSTPLLVTPNRFTRTSQSACWNTGNGSPDAIAFSVDKPGIVIAGICVYGGGGQYQYELELLDDISGAQSDPSPSQRWNNLELVRGCYGPEDCVNDIAEIKFDRPVPIKEGVKYTLRLKNHGPKTLNGDGGLNKVKCPDGTTFNFAACSLSSNGTNHMRGQVPQLLYYSAPQEGESQQQTNKTLAELQARKNAIDIVGAICRMATDMLHRANSMSPEDITKILGESHLFSSLIPMILAHIGPVASQDPRGAVQVLGMIQEILPPVSNLNNYITPPRETEEPEMNGGTTSHHYAVVESDHPYKPATVSHYKVTFPEQVKWMAVEFDPSCGTAQTEDVLQLLIPTRTGSEVMPQTNRNEEHKHSRKYCSVYKKFSGSDNWPKQALILPGNKVVFSLETASDYVKDEKACFFGFKCIVVGYEWKTKPEEAISQLERELAYLGGMCAGSLIKKDIALPPVTVEELDEDMDYIEEGSLLVFNEHSKLLGKGFALSHPPTIMQALEGNLPFCWQSNERSFLKDFVACSPGTSGGRMARWLQPDSYLDPSQCELAYNKDDLRCSWPAMLTVLTKDQYGALVQVNNLKVEVKAIPVDQGILGEDSKKTRRLSRPDNTNMTFGGLPPPCLDVPYEPTVKDKKDIFHAISMMKQYENYSFEELRVAAPAVPRPSENMLVRSNNDGTYMVNWTPGSVGLYNIHVTIDGFDTGEVYKVDVADPPQGITPPSQTEKKPHHTNKLRKFVQKYSAGLRARTNPSLQSEQIGVIPPEGIISFIDEIHNDDGVWLRLSQDSIREYCINGHIEGWVLQYNQHLGKTLLVPVEEPKSIAKEILKETIRRNLKAEASKHKRGPGNYQVIKCGSFGHNIRCGPSLKSTPVGMLTMDDKVLAINDKQNQDGHWIKIDPESAESFCQTKKGEFWSLVQGKEGIVYLQHEHDVKEGITPVENEPFSFASPPSGATGGFNFGTSPQIPSMNSMFGTLTPPAVTGPFGRSASLPTNVFSFGHNFQGSTPSHAPAFGQRPVSDSYAASFDSSYHSSEMTHTMSHPSFGSESPFTPGSSSFAKMDTSVRSKSPMSVTRSPVSGSPKSSRRDPGVPPELQGVSVKDLVKALVRSCSPSSKNYKKVSAWLRHEDMDVIRSTSIKRLATIIGESRANGNGPTPVPSPPGTPKKAGSRSSSPHLAPEAAGSPRTGSPNRSLSPKLAKSDSKTVVSESSSQASLKEETFSTPPDSPLPTRKTKLKKEPSFDRFSQSPPSSPVLKGKLHDASKDGRSSPGGSGLLSTARAESFSSPPTVHGRKESTGSPLPQRRESFGSPRHTSPARNISPQRNSPRRGSSPLLYHHGSPRSSPVMGSDQPGDKYFNIGSGPAKDDSPRMSPKLGRKDRRQLRSKRDRPGSPSPKDTIPVVRSRSSSTSIVLEKTKEPVKEALSPSVAECLRSVFAAFLWHEGIVHDAMACASFLKFHPDLHKEMSKFANKKKQERIRVRHATDSSKELNKKRENININEARVRFNLEPQILRSDSEKSDKSDKSDKSEKSESPVLARELKFATKKPVERHKSEGSVSHFEREDMKRDEEKGSSSSALPPTLQHLVYFWEELSSGVLRIILNDLVYASPAVTLKAKKGEKKDKEKEKERKNKKKKEQKQVIRGNAFGEAMVGIFGRGGADGGAYKGDTWCELCGATFPHPVTYHMRQAHPGCGRHAGGKGYNSSGNFCGGWAGNCGEGGYGGSGWYLICETCRDKYLKDKKQQQKEKDKAKKMKKKNAQSRAQAILSPQEPHVVLKANAMFLLDLASASGFTLPVNSHKKHSHPHSTELLLPSVYEEYGQELNPFPQVPFTYLVRHGAQNSDSAFADDFYIDAEERVFVRSGSMSIASKNTSFTRPRLPTEPRHSPLARSGSLGQDMRPSLSHISPPSPRDFSVDSNTNTADSKQTPRSAGTSPESELDQLPKKTAFQRSISEYVSDNDDNSERNLGKYSGRRRNNSGGVTDGGMSLLKHPSAAMSKLIMSVDKGMSENDGDGTLQRPVMSFIVQRHDLEGLQLAMRQALRKSSCRVFALQALNWLLRSVTQMVCLHDLMWFFVASLTPPNEEEEEEEEEAEKGKEKKKKDVKKDQEDAPVCEHPLQDVTVAGQAVEPLTEVFHTLLQTTADVMIHLPWGSAIQQMAVHCFCLNFKPSDHQFLHESHVFSNISRILSKSEEENDDNSDSGQVPRVKGSCEASYTICNLKDLTPSADIKASSRQAMISSLSDNSTETFWESGDEDRNKTKTVTITCFMKAFPKVIYVHVDNTRDLANKVSSIVFNAGPSAEDVSKMEQVDVDSRFTGWLSCHIPEPKCRCVHLELKGPDHNLRVRQVKVLGEMDGENIYLPVKKSTVDLQQENCETETLRVFRMLTSQVFGKLIVDKEDNKEEKKKSLEPGDSLDGDHDLKEHMVGILFSRSKLSHLQKQVCSHIVQGIRKETSKMREEWESQLTNNTPPVSDNSDQDAYCFELLSMVLALSGSGVGRTYLAQQYPLLQDLFSLLHTGTPRIQRQVISVLRRVLPEAKPQTLASILSVPNLPPSEYSIVSLASREDDTEDYDVNKPGILDVLLACISKALTVQTKVKASGPQKGVTSLTLAECQLDSSSASSTGSRWWMRGKMDSAMANKIISLIQDMASGCLSETWATVTKAAVAEAILALTKLDENIRNPQVCAKTPTLWLALSSLCVLDKDHVDRLTSGQWVSSPNGQHGQPRPTCDNHDDGETQAIILCSECGNLCADCDKYLHLPKKNRNHQRQVFKEEEEAIRVDLHEGCGRTKLFWLMALADSRTLKAMVEFREGKQSTAKAGPGVCRFCGASGNTGLLAIGNVCADPDCQEYAKTACPKTLPCGHPCRGIKDEDPCLPCLHRCGKQETLKQDADDMCMICFTEALSAAPAVQLKCNHVFHLHCSQSILSKRWVGPRITFGFSLCPICKCTIDHPVLRDLLKPIQELFEDVRRKAMMRLEYEGLHKAEAITTPGARFYQDPAGFAMDRYAYYVCFKCKKAYYGGEARCEEQAGAVEEYDPQELVCGGCSDVSRAQVCPKHGTDFLEYKCRYCCSVAVFFCFGTTHFCNACHDDFQRITNIPKPELPRCPAGPRGKVLDGDECPLHVQHPPTGEEFALGCGVCRNAHTF